MMLTRSVVLFAAIATVATPVMAAGDVETDTAALATGAAVGGLVGGAIFSAAGLTAALFEQEPALATVFVGLAFGGVLLGPAVGAVVAAFVGSIDPWLSVPATVGAIAIGLAGGWLGALLGFPLGTLVFGQTSPGPPLGAVDYAVFTTTVVSTALHTAAAAGVGAVAGYGGMLLLFPVDQE
jgi:hypothetical protein